MGTHDSYQRSGAEEGTRACEGGAIGLAVEKGGGGGSGLAGRRSRA